MTTTKGTRTGAAGADRAGGGAVGSGGGPGVVADRLHSTAIHLLRRLRVEDDASGLTAPRLSALSVIVFGGPLTLGELAAAEQLVLGSVFAGSHRRKALLRRLSSVLGSADISSAAYYEVLIYGLRGRAVAPRTEAGESH